MDLPQYLDSFRQGFDVAVRDFYSRIQALSGMAGPPGVGMPGMSEPGGRHGGHHHGHHGHHGHDHHHDCGCHDDDSKGCGCGCHGSKERECGCHDDRDCRCECCIEDADVVVYAHCGEIRVVPIEVANDTRRDRDDVSVEVSDVRSAGGRTLPWKVLVNPQGPLTLPACSTTKLELLVHIVCGDPKQNGDSKTKPARGDQDQSPLRIVAAQRLETGDVDECEVGYVTIRLGGCLVRPIVVAIAALPDICDSYRVGCACSCCC
ncbi:MAG TPA: hypothetical protein VH496_19730 [Mycobacterium sp.]